MQNEISKKEFRLNCLATARAELAALKATGTATPEQINNVEYKIALHIGILHDMNGMSI